jgi:hypothetical protein
MKWIKCLLLFASACLGLLLAGAAPAAAESAPVKVFLNYMPNVSNYGPASATAVAILNIGDGEITLDADGLPLVAGLAYEVWLSVSTDPVAMTSLGKFNPGANGVAHYHQIIEDLPRAEYRFVILTVESDPDLSPAASQRRSLVGIIPDVNALAPTPTPLPARPASAQTGGAQPTAQPAGGQPATGQPAGATPPPPMRLPTTGGVLRPPTPAHEAQDAAGWLVFSAVGLTILYSITRGRRA